MGCHTWSYIRFNPKKEDVERLKKDFEKLYKEYMGCTPQEIFLNNLKRLQKKYPSYKPDESSLPSQEEMKEEVEYWRNYLIENNVYHKVINDDDFSYDLVFIDPSDYLLPKEDDKNDLLFYEGNWYLGDDKIAGDLFRVSEYPKDVFLDSESLIKWLETRDYVGYYPSGDSNLGLCDELKKEIRKVYSENPGLLINFG